MSSRSPSVRALRRGKHITVERRAAVRHRCLRHCLVHLDMEAPGIGNWTGMTYDISTMGIGVALLYSLAPGTKLVIEKFGPNNAVTLRAQVVRSVPMEFVWLHGCQLLTPLQQGQLQDWLK